MYNWTPGEALGLLGIQIQQKNQYMKCPACGGKKFQMQTEMGMGHCWRCNFKADTASYYAAEMGMSVEDARRDIENRLGIANATPTEIKERKERIVYNTEAKGSETAPDDVLDDTYRAFLSILPVNARHLADMKARCGANPDQVDAWMYRTYPLADGSISYFNICKRLQSEGKRLEGVPMFYRAKGGEGDFTFIQQTQGIIMPCINHKRQIVGLMNRKDDEKRIYREDLEDYEPKCGWLSSKNKPCGAGAVARIHYACDWKFDAEAKEYKPVFDNGFVLTEGFMKADIIHYLMPNLPVIAVPGVNNTNLLKTELERLKSWGVEGIYMAYDMDYATNPNVKKALDKTIELIKACGLKCAQKTWPTTHEGLPEGVSLKGMDDYLAYTKLGIVPTIKKIGT